MLLDELGQNLNEDMEDLDEFEQGTQLTHFSRFVSFVIFSYFLECVRLEIVIRKLNEIFSYLIAHTLLYMQ